MSAQGTEAWFADRLGKLTASRMADVLARIKSGEAASRANYRAELVAERLSGKRQESFTSKQMQWGTESEPLAISAYEAEFGVLVEKTGLVDHPAIAMSGASPDGLVGDDGLIECKCPDTKTHIETILSDSVPSRYMPQIMWQLACTGRAWCDFVSFDPRMPMEQQLFVKRVQRDEALIAEYEAEAIQFLSEVDATESRLKNWRLAV